MNRKRDLHEFSDSYSKEFYANDIHDLVRRKRYFIATITGNINSIYFNQKKFWKILFFQSNIKWWFLSFGLDLINFFKNNVVIQIHLLKWMLISRFEKWENWWLLWWFHWNDFKHKLWKFTVPERYLIIRQFYVKFNFKQFYKVLSGHGHIKLASEKMKKVDKDGPSSRNLKRGGICFRREPANICTSRNEFFWTG